MIWSQLAEKLLRLLLPHRKHGCLCEQCLEDEILRAEQAIEAGFTRLEELLEEEKRG